MCFSKPEYFSNNIKCRNRENFVWEEDLVKFLSQKSLLKGKFSRCCFHLEILRIIHDTQLCVYSKLWITLLHSSHFPINHDQHTSLMDWSEHLRKVFWTSFVAIRNSGSETEKSTPASLGGGKKKMQSSIAVPREGRANGVRRKLRLLKENVSLRFPYFCCWCFIKLSLVVLNPYLLFGTKLCFN